MGLFDVIGDAFSSVGNFAGDLWGGSGAFASPLGFLLNGGGGQQYAPAPPGYDAYARGQAQRQASINTYQHNNPGSWYQDADQSGLDPALTGADSPWAANALSRGGYMPHMSTIQAARPIQAAYDQAHGLGGALGPAQAQRGYAAMAGGLARQGQQQDRQRMSALEQQGMNSMYASERMAMDPYRHSRGLSQYKAQLEAQAAQGRMGYGQDYSSALSNLFLQDVAGARGEKMQQIQQQQYSKGLETALYAGLGSALIGGGAAIFGSPGSS